MPGQPAAFDHVLAALAQYDFRGRSEQDVREEWITPLLVRLGYGPSTLHQIRRGESVRLRVPMRMLGSSRFQLDYRPTVHGRGLWIIEAKAPEGIDPQMHLAQAWTYATHPEINVPLFVLADGQRIAVHDVNAPTWDVPVIELQAAELPSRFPELAAVLSPRSAARMARRRLIDHLKRVMSSELDYSALDETLEDVRAAISRARPSVDENRRVVAESAAREREAAEEHVLMAARLWGLAQERNIPFGWSRNDVSRALRVIDKATGSQQQELEQMFAAVRGRDGEDRVFWGLRTYRLAVALATVRRFQSLSEPSWVRPAIRDHLLAFPNDPAAAAAHRLELALFVWTVRTLSQPHGPARARIEQWLNGLGVEAQLSLGPFMHTHSAVLQAALLLCRAVWANLRPWEVGVLGRAAEAFTKVLKEVPCDAAFVKQYVGLSASDDWADHDPLIDYTIIAVAEWKATISLDEREVAVVRSRVNAPGTVAEAAQRLLERQDSNRAGG